MLKALPYRPGVIKDDSELASQGYATDSESIRWVRGRAEALGGWETLASGVNGVARTTAEFVTEDGLALIAIGTSAGLFVWDGADIVDITPLRSSGTAGADPIATTDGSSSVVVTIATHEATVGATVYLRGADEVGGVQIGGLSGTSASNPFTTFTDSKRVLVSHTAHGLATNDIAHFASATETGGVPAATLNLADGHRVKVLNADLYEIEVGVAATSAASGGGTPTYAYAKPYVISAVTGNTITITGPNAATSTTSGGGSTVGYQFDINPGSVTTTVSGSGYGSGLYGAGIYGESTSTGLIVNTLPARTWSMAIWGTQLIANIVEAGIYLWTGNRSQRAALLTNAPAQCNGVLVTPQRFLLALGCTDGGGDFDQLLIRFPDGLDLTDWTPSATNNAGSVRLGVGTEIVGGLISDSGPLVWTDVALYRISYVGEFDQIYDEDMIGQKCGLLAPNAVVQTGQGDTYWLSSSYQFFVYSGGEPQEVICPLRRWFEERVEKDQRLKVVASHDARYPAVIWDYQSTSSDDDVDAYVRLDIAEQKADPNAGWSHGGRARSAWASGVVFKARAPLALSPAGVLYQHDLDYGDDGAEIARYVRWAPAQIEDGDKLTVLTRVVVDGVYTDRFTVTLYGRLYPNQAEFSRGPHEINTKGYMDRKMKARQIGMRIDSSSADFWRLGVLRGDVQSSSER